MANRFTILVCRGPECGDKRDSAAVYDAFEAELRAQGMEPDPVELGRYSCFGRCRRGPNVLVREILPNENQMMVRMMPTSGKGATLYHGVLPSEAREVIETHIRQGKKLEHLMQRNSVAPPAATDDALSPLPVIKP